MADAKQIQPDRRAWTCQLGESPVRLTGIAILDNGPYQKGKRGVFVTYSSDSEFAFGEISFHRVREPADSRSRGCRVDRAFWSVPNDLMPRILVDARVRYLALYTGVARGNSEAVTLYEIQWDVDDKSEPVNARLTLRTPMPFTDDRAIAVVKSAFKVDEPVELDRIATVPTWPTLGGFGFKTGDQGNWRLFNEELQWMDGSVQGNWEPLQPAKPDDTSPCGRLQKVVNDRMAAKLDQDGFESQTLVYPPSEADEALCIVIKRGGPEPASGTQTREQVLVSLYNPRHMRALHAQLPGNKLALPPALATVVAAERRRPADPGCTREDPKRANGSPCRPPDDWYIGSKGDINGWIAVGNVADKAHVRGPLTTEALRRLGCDVLRESLRAQKPGETPPPQCLD